MMGTEIMPLHASLEISLDRYALGVDRSVVYPSIQD